MIAIIKLIRVGCFVECIGVRFKILKNPVMNKQQLESMVDVFLKVAQALLDRGCEIFRGMTFTINNSTALANLYCLYAIEDSESYMNLMRCASLEDLKLLPKCPQLTEGVEVLVKMGEML